MLESSPDELEETPEFSYEDGLHAVVERISKLLNQQDIVTVAIAGPLEDDRSVGKSSLTSDLSIALRRLGLPVVEGSSYDSIENLGMVENLRFNQHNLSSPKGVLILGAMGCVPDSFSNESVSRYKDMQKERLCQLVAPKGLAIRDFDVRILIYRSGQKSPGAGPRLFSDFIIRNEKARVRI